MAIGKQDIGLLFGVLGGGSISGESGQLIKSQLDSIVASLNNATNSKQRRIALSLDAQGTKSAFSSGIKQITDGLSGQKQFRIKISEIDATSAISNVKKQLQAMLSALSVSNGVNITGLKDFIGVDGVDASLKQTAAAADAVIGKMNAAKTEASNWAGQMKVLNTISQSLAATYKSGVSGKNMISDSAAVKEITTAYSAWQQKVEAIRTSKRELSSQELESLQEEGNAIQRKITEIQNEQIAQAKAAAEAEKKAAAEKAAAEKVSGANQDQVATLKEVVSLYSQIDSYLKRNTKASGTAAYDELEAMRVQLEQIINAGGQISKIDLSNLKTQFSTITANMRQAGKEGKSLGDVISAAYQKFGGWMLVTRSFSAIIRSLKQMVSNVVDIDTAMTELKKVTEETDKTYATFLENAAARAKTVGATLTDTINASADFARLGYGLEDASTLADVALVYKNVGDGIEDVGEASESVISTMKAFGVEASNSMVIVDKFNAVGNNFAISSGGVGDALMRSASALSAANNTLDESIALVTAANNVIQDPDKVGTALKTVSMYLRAAKTEAEEAGESTEGMATSVSKLRDDILALTAGKVDIQIDEDTFKSTYQIIKELSGVWGELTDITQANIIEMIGGKRNSNVVTALLSNFSTAEEVIAVAAGSAGSALAENEKYMDSIAGKISVFQAAFEDLSATTINSDFVKGAVDFGTGILETINSIIDALGTIPTLLTAIGAALGAKNVNSILSPFQVTATGTTLGVGTQLSRDIDAVNKYNDAIKKAAASGIDLSKDTNALGEIISDSMKNASQSTKRYVESQNGAQVATSGLTGKLVANKVATYASVAAQTALNAVWSLGISLLITGIITGLSKLINAQENAAQKARETADEISSSYKEACDEIDAGLKTVTEIEDEFNALAAGVDKYGKNISLSTSEYERYQEIVSEVLSISPSLVAGYDNEGRAIADKNTLLEESIRLLKEEQKLRVAELVSDDTIEDLGMGAVQDIKDYMEDNPLPYGDAKWDFIWAFQDAAERYASEQQGNYEGQIYDLLHPDSRDLDDFWTEGYWSEYGTNAQNFASDYYEIIVDALRNNREILSDYFTQDEIDNLLDIADIYDANIGTYESRLAQYSKGLNSTLQIVPQIVDGYDTLTDAQKGFIASYINGLEIGADTTEDDIINMKYAIIDMVEAMTDENLGERVNELMSIDPSTEASIGEYINKIKGAISGLAEDFSIDEDDLTKSLGFDTIFARYQAMADRIAENVPQTSSYILSELSLDELQIAFDAVNAGGVSTWEDILRAIEDYNSAEAIALRGLESYKQTVGDLWDSDGFADARSALLKLSDASGITADDIEKLADDNEALSEILGKTGMDAKFLAQIFQTIATGGNGLALITEDALKLNDALFDMTQEFDNVTAAKARYDSAMSVEEKDTGFRSYADAFEALNAEFEAGTVNSNAFWAAAEYLFGSDQLMTWGWSDGLDEIYAAMQRNIGIFGDADSAGAGFIDKLYEMSEAGELVDEMGEPLLEITKLADGSYDFDIDTGNLDEIAKKLGITTEAVTACLQALSMWGDVNFYDMDEVLATIGEIGLSADTLDGTAINVEALINQLVTLGKTDKEIYDILTALKGLDGVVLLDTAADIDTLTGSLTNLGLASDDGVTVSVNADGLSDLMSQLNFTKEDAQELINKLGEADGITLTNAQGEAQGVADALEYIDTLDFATVTENIDTVERAIDDVDNSTTDNAVGEINDIGSAAQTATNKVNAIRTALQKVDGTKVTVTVDVQRTGSLLAGIFGYASGTTGAPAGPALLGEEDEELVQSGDRAYLVGTNGPEIVNLKKGDRVYTASETKRIKRGSGRHIVGSIPAYAWGTINTDTDKKGSTGTPYTPPSATVEVDVTAKVDNKSLEESLKETLDELQERINDIIGNYEHEIFMLEKNGGTTEEIIAIYKKMQQAIHEQAEEYRRLGLDENSDYIQDLSEQWWGYQDSITQLRQDDFDDYLNDSKFAIDALTHDGNDTATILASWRNILKAINDEIAYYTSIGYDASSEVIQSLMKEVWDAEEAMQSVLDNVVQDAQNAIDDLQDVYETLKDAATEYTETGYVSVDTLQSIIDLGVEYIAFLRDENGQIVINEENIQRMMAAKTQQLAVESALNYVEQLRIAIESGQTEELQRLLTATTDATSATWGLVYANLALLNLSGDQYAQALNNINTLRSIADNTIANIGYAMSDNGNDRSDYYDDAADALDTILDLTMDLIKHEKEQQVEALEAQIDKYREIIDLKKESLQTTKDENDYNKEVATRIKEIASLQARIDKLSLDGSREAQAEKRTLEEELAEKQGELADYQSDYAIEKQQDRLDAEADAFEKSKNDEIKEVEDTISSTEKLYQLAIARIGTDWDGLYQDLLKWNYEYGNTLESELVTAWNTASAAVQEYGSYLEAVAAIDAAQAAGSGNYNVVGQTGDYASVSGPEASNVVNQMKANSLAWWTSSDSERNALDTSQIDLAKQLSAILGENITRKNGSWYRADGSVLYTFSKDEVATAIVDAMKANSEQWSGASASERTALESENRLLASRLQGYIGQTVTIDGNGEWWINGKKLYEVYHSGGVAGGIPTLKQNEVMAILERGEPVLDKKKEDGLYKIIDFATVLSERLGKAISTDGFGSVMGTNRKMLPSIESFPELGSSTNNAVSFSPVINVTIDHSGDMTDSDAARIGRIVAENTLSELSDAFNKRGIGRIGSSALKQL